MKKTRLLALLLAFCALLGLPGCSLLSGYKTNRLKAIASYSVESGVYPQSVIPVEDGWFALIGNYGETGYAVTFGATPDKLKTIYEENESRVWFIEAKGSLAAWSDKTVLDDHSATYRFRVYDRSKEMITEFYIAECEEFYPENIGIYGRNVYWCATDAEKETAEIRSYSVDSGTTETVFKSAYNGEDSLSCLTVDGEYLSVAHWNREGQPMVTVLSLATGQVVIEQILPSWVRHVFAVSYDSTNSKVVLYLLRGNGKESLYAFPSDGGEYDDEGLFLICDFKEGIYAYHDRVKCRDGHVYWIFQLNRTGNVSDHYFLADYSFRSDKITEYRRTYAFSVEGERMYTLSFNRQNYTAVDLRPF